MVFRTKNETEKLVEVRFFVRKRTDFLFNRTFTLKDKVRVLRFVLFPSRKTSLVGFPSETTFFGGEGRGGPK